MTKRKQSTTKNRASSHGHYNKTNTGYVGGSLINSRIIKNEICSEDFSNVPSWTFIENKEIKISSTEIRRQREKLRGKY